MGLPRECFTRACRRLSKACWAKLLKDALGILFLHIWIMCEIISKFKNIFTPSSVLGVRTDFWFHFMQTGQIYGRDKRIWEWFLYMISKSLWWDGLSAWIGCRLVKGTVESPNQTNLGLHSSCFSDGITPSRSFNVWETRFNLSKIQR